MLYSNQSIFLKATLSTLCSGNDLFSFLFSPFSAHFSLWNWVLGRVPTVWGKRHKGSPPGEKSSSRRWRMERG